MVCSCVIQPNRHTPHNPPLSPALQHRSVTFLFSSRLSTAAAMSKRAASDPNRDEHKQLQRSKKQEMRPDQWPI